MKELVVLGFASRELAEEARSRSAEFDLQGALNLDGAALAYRRNDGPVELVQPIRLAPIGAATRGVRRCAGDAAARARAVRRRRRAAGAAGAGLSALGLNQWFLRQVDETLESGRAALFVVVSGGPDPERAIEALQPFGPRVLRTNLDSAAEQRLLAAFAEAAPQASSKSPSPPASEGPTTHAARRRAATACGARRVRCRR
jgi:uncharacterized membrane protein